MDKADLIGFRRNLTRLQVLLGAEEKRALECEVLARQHARRSLVAANAIPAGTKITSEALTWKRPAHGISPSEIDQVLGRTTVCDIQEDELLSWDRLEREE